MMSSDRRGIVLLSATLGTCAALVWYFHDRFWWPVDEGVYAYVAQRINAGDVPHRDLIDLHAGYVNLLHALAFRLFGEDLVSLRYPLALLTIVQAWLAVLLLRPRGIVPAAVAALVVTAFSFIQFLNPSANWYALFLFFVTVWVLTRVDATRPSGAILVGFLIGLCFLFRQLSGVFLAMGVLTWILVRPQPRAEGRGLLARALLVIMALGLGGYLWSKGSITGLLLIGIWPLAFLLWATWHARVADAGVARLILRLALGAGLAAAPLAIYHLAEGSFVAWLNDVLFTAFLIHKQDFIARASFLLLVVGGLQGLSDWREPVVFLNGLFWLALIAAPALLGWLLLRNAARSNPAPLVHPLPVMAAFFALVALHYEIPIYLLVAIAPVLAAVLWLACDGPLSRAAPGVLLSVAVIGVAFQAGQPLSRGLLGTIRGERIALDAPEGLPRASLAMERADQTVYRALIARIEGEARPGEVLFGLPMEPELNFLTGRPAPVPYYGTPLGLRHPEDVDDTMRRLESAAPIFVVHRREDKYLTPLSRDLLARIRRLDPTPESFGPFDLYRLPGRAAPSATRTVRE